MISSASSPRSASVGFGQRFDRIDEPMVLLRVVVEVAANIDQLDEADHPGQRLPEFIPPQLQPHRVHGKG